MSAPPPSKRPPADRGQGRKPKPATEKLVPSSVRLTAAQWAKFKALGGSDWLRAVIDSTRAPR